jgi:hypothetical protein
MTTKPWIIVCGKQVVRAHVYRTEREGLFATRYDVIAECTTPEAATAAGRLFGATERAPS